MILALELNHRVMSVIIGLLCYEVLGLTLHDWVVTQGVPSIREDKMNSMNP